MLSLRDQTITGYPVVEDVIEQQARPILLLDVGLVRTNVIEMAHSNGDQGIAFGHVQMLLRDAGEDESNISARDVEDLGLVL